MSDIKPARTELLALAARVRSQDRADALDGALTAAANSGWDWRRTGAYACRLMFDAGAEPRDLLEAAGAHARQGTFWRPPTPEWVAAREALGAVRPQVESSAGAELPLDGAESPPGATNTPGRVSQGAEGGRIEHRPSKAMPAGRRDGAA